MATDERHITVRVTKPFVLYRILITEGNVTLYQTLDSDDAYHTRWGAMWAAWRMCRRIAKGKHPVSMPRRYERTWEVTV